MSDHRQDAISSIQEVLFDALMICDNWCEDEDYGYDLNHIIAITKLILEQEERYRIADED